MAANPLHYQHSIARSFSSGRRLYLLNTQSNLSGGFVFFLETIALSLWL